MLVEGGRGGAERCAGPASATLPLLADAVVVASYGGGIAATAFSVRETNVEVHARICGVGVGNRLPTAEGVRRKMGWY